MGRSMPLRSPSLGGVPIATGGPSAKLIAVSVVLAKSWHDGKSWHLHYTQ